MKKVLAIVFISFTAFFSAAHIASAETMAKKILIVPGHEPKYGGANFGSVYERDLVLTLGQYLNAYLSADPKFKTYITRDPGGWNSVFDDYFKNNWYAILSWKFVAKNKISIFEKLGVEKYSAVEHNAAPENVASRLFGITKWSNENGIDLMVHLHLNDYPDHSAKKPGEYSGRVIFIPAKQYKNSETTKVAAEAVSRQLAPFTPESDNPVEEGGILHDADLIAVGVEDTSNAPSMLIEYDYIYQPQFLNAKIRDLALKDLAYQTYLGLYDHFYSTAKNAAPEYDPSLVYAWKKRVTSAKSDPKDIYALQTALILDGSYPPKGKTLHDCPRSGVFGACTKAGVREFQAKHDLVGWNVFSEKTFLALQKVYNGE